VVFQQWGKNEILLNSGVSAMGKKKKMGKMRKMLLKVVFQQWEK
jgi:hypothetical protein